MSAPHGGQEAPTTVDVGLHPAFIVKYGGPGEGKTTDDIYSFAGCGLFLAQPGALRTAKTVVGFDLTPQTVECYQLEQVPDWIDYAALNGFGALVVDDASLIMGNTFTEGHKVFALFKADGTPKGHDRAMWNYFRNVVNTVCVKARWAGIHVVFNNHYQEAFTDKDGAKYPAGPDFIWKKLVKLATYEADVCMKTKKRMPGTPTWDTVCDTDVSVPNESMKDRTDGAPPVNCPLNTAELLRSKGFVIPRPAGLEWMEDWVEPVAQAVLAGGPGLQAEQAARAPFVQQLIQQGVLDLHARWVLRDGTHRARFRAYQQKSVLAGF